MAGPLGIEPVWSRLAPLPLTTFPNAGRVGGTILDTVIDLGPDSGLWRYLAGGQVKGKILRNVS